MKTLPTKRVQQLLQSIRDLRVLVVGDVMLDQFIYGRVSRISPEAPVPIVRVVRERSVLGGAANATLPMDAVLYRHLKIFGTVMKSRTPDVKQDRKSVV